MKRKVLMLSLAVALVAILALSATLAYFTDTDKETNSFTIGDVEIDLVEEFAQNSNLVPAVSQTDPGTGATVMNNAVNKVVNVENIGDNDAYVRVHIAVPDFEIAGATGDVIATIKSDASIADGQWSWGEAVDGFNIGGIPYKAYCITYATVLEPNATTATNAIDKVYLNPAVTNENIKGWDTLYGDGNWEKVYVYAEGVQAEGFSDAASALNTAFGTPATAYYQNLDWTVAAQG